MINSAPKGLVLGLPSDPVVEGATGEQSDRRERKNAQSYTSFELIGDGNQDQARNQRNRRHDQVDQPTKLGFMGRQIRGFEAIHPSTVAPRGSKAFGVSHSSLP